MLCRCVAEIGLDPNAAREYLESDEGFAEVNASVESLHRAGVHSIPVFIIKAARAQGGTPTWEQVVHGSADVDRFRQVFREIAAWAKDAQQC
jgi:predicted DsbA family dithiol-disulfide isomerase